MMFGIENSLFDKTAKLDKASRDAYNRVDMVGTNHNKVLTQ